MKHLVKLLSTSLKRIEEGNTDTAKLIIKQVMTELQHINGEVPKDEVKTVINSQSFKDYFIGLIKDTVVSENNEGEEEDPYMINEYKKNGSVFMEYDTVEKVFHINQDSMGITTTYLNQNTDIEIYGGTKKFNHIVKGILRDYYKVPVEEVRVR
jgi:hypothetical protein